MLILLGLLTRCANPVSPEGGPKDIAAPFVVKCVPPDQHTMFTGKTIRVEFDEYINAETSGDKILISPPLSESPDYRLRGKSLVIAFRDSLQPNTTYSLDFGTSISDITENNKLSGFRYAFSTGPVLDSLMLTGTVNDAFTNAPVKEVLVMLYRPGNDTLPDDSLPIRVRPSYLTRTDEQGRFSLTNLGEGPFKLFALADKSGDLLFNLVGEAVAFADSLVFPVPDPASVTADTSVADSVDTAPVPVPVIPLRLFETKDSVQSLDKVTLIRDRMAQLVFRYPPDSLTITLLNSDTLAPWCLTEKSVRGDTITLWLHNKLPDTLNLRVYAAHMTLPDTVELPTRHIEPARKGKKVEEPRARRLEISSGTRGGIFNHFKGPFLLIPSYPVSRCAGEELRLISGSDTVPVKPVFADSLRRILTVSYPWKEGTAYQLFAPDSFLMDINGLFSDTLRIRFKTAESRNFANLRLNISLPEHSPPVIIQLMTEKEKVLEEQIIARSGFVRFDVLLPAKYRIKAIFDANKNRQWDTGDYIRSVQPEKVSYFPRILELRANWDVEESWELN